MADQSQSTIVREQSYNSIREKYDLLVEISDNLERLRFDQQRLEEEIPSGTYHELQAVLGTNKDIEGAEAVIVHSLKEIALIIDYSELEQAKADGILSDDEVDKAVRLKREVELLSVRSDQGKEQRLEL